MVGAEKNEQSIKLEKIASGVFGALLTIAGLTLVAWPLGWRSLLAPLNGSLPINPLTSVEFVLLTTGITFWRRGSSSRVFFNVVLPLLLVFDTFVLLGKIFRFSPFIDTILFHQQMADYPGVQVLNGMSTATAICFILTIVSLQLMRHVRFLLRVREALNILVFFISFGVIIFYLYRVPEALPFFWMAPLTAVLFSFFSVGILLLQPRQGLVEQFLLGPFSQSPARILVPLSLIFPVILGYVRLYGEWYHLISPELGVSLIILTVVAVLTASTWVVARSFNQRMNLSAQYQRQASHLATANEELQALSEELQASNEALTTNLNELHKVNQALEKANATIARQKDEQLNRVLNSTNDVVWSFDLTGKGENYLSHSAERVYRQPYETLLARPYFWLEPVLPADKTLKQESQTRLMETGETSCTYRVLIDGNVRWVRDDLRLIKDESGIPVRLEGVASDITEILEKEAEVTHERNLLRALIDNIPSYIFLRDANLKTILSNRAAYTLLGVNNEDQVIGRDLIDYYGEQARSLYDEEKNVLRTGEPLLNREVKVNVQGRDTLLSVSKVPIKDESGKVIQVIGISHDITDLRKQEDELKQYRQNLEIVFKNSADNFVLVDRDAKIVLFNEGFKRFPEEMLGITPQLGMSIFDVLPADRIEPSRGFFERVLQGESIDIVAKSIFKGTPRYFSVRYNPVRHDGEVKFVSISAFDITEKKNQEIKLAEYQQELEMVFNNSSDIFFLVDKHENLTLFNQRFSEYCKYVMGTVPTQGNQLQEAIAPQHREKYQAIIQRALRGESFDFLDKVDFNLATLHLFTRAQPIFEQGEVTHVMVSIADRTADLKKEEEVRKYRENLEMIFENSTDLLILMTSDARIIFYNKEFEKYASTYPKIHIENGTSLLDVIADNRKATVSEILKRVRAGEQIKMEAESIFEEETKYHYVVYTPVRKNNAVTHIALTSTDISERKKQETQLENFRQNLEIIFQNTTDFFVLLNTSAEIVILNRPFENYIRRHTKAEPKAGTSLYDVVAPNRKEAVREIIQRVLKGERIHVVSESRFEDETRFYDVIYTPVIKGDTVTHISVTSTDITERKNQEMQLEKFRQDLEIIFKNSADNFVLVDRNFNISLCNESFVQFAKKFTGVTPTLGTNYLECMPADRVEANRNAIRAAFEGVTSQSIGKTDVLGEPHYFSIRYSPVTRLGERTHVSVSAFDITEQKKQELVARQYQDTLEIVFKTSRDTFVLISAEGKVVSFNEAFEKFINDVAGIQPRVGSDFLEVVAPHRRVVAAELFKKTLRGVRSAIDAEFKSSAGKKIFQYIRYEPIVSDGKVMHVCVTAVDITAFRNIENELKRDQYFLDKASESARIGYWTSEPGYANGKLTWSKEVFKIFGISEVGFSGTNKEFFERVYPEDRDRVVELSRRAIENDSVYDVDHRIILADGSVRWVNEKAQIIRDENQKATLMVGVIQDINDRKMIERVLREYNERFEVLSKATNDAIWDLDMGRDVETWNHGLETIFGYEQREVSEARKWWAEKIHPDDYARVIAEMNQVIANRQSNWISEYRYKCADGIYKNVLDRAYVVYTGDKATRMIGAMQDITEVVQYRQNLEAIIEERTQKLNASVSKEKELVNLKSKFISIASHEFRTPLATIALSTGFLKRFSERLQPQQIVEKAGAIERQVHHMSALVDDVLFVGKSEEGKVKVEKKLTPITIFEKLAVEAVSSRGDSHHLQFINRTNINEFETDEKLLRNIVVNLVSNAIKFSPKAQHVYVSLLEQEEKLCLSVRDEGIGIPAEDSKNLFASFTRASNAHNIEGTGLGLVIIKRAVELLNGTIEVQSELGKGTEFTVRLPL